MIKYYKFDLVKTTDTILEFRAVTEDAKINWFTGVPDRVVSIVGADEDILKTIAAQPPEINVQEISKDEFQTAVADSDQISVINRRVKEQIAQRYDTADEIAMLKRPSDDPKRVDYEAFISDCLAYGDSVKAEIGYN